jgi:Spy/CpxP family protein refolding chaperone
MKSIGYRLMVAALAVMLGGAVAKSQTAEAAPPPPMHGHGFGMEEHMLGFAADYLNLTDAQEAQMKAIMQKEHPNLKPLHEQERAIDAQLRGYVTGTYDEAKVQALAAQKGQLQTQMTVAETRIHNELYQILTPEQQAQMKQVEANREARMQKHMQEHSAPQQ